MISNIFFSATSFNATNALLQKLKDNYAKYPLAHHIFIVPDRVSVLTEIKIFETLGIDSTCNIEVLTLSRLASKIIEQTKVISKTSSCMIFQKLLNENKDNLKCFNKKTDSNLANTLYETVSQFKSCKINFDKVKVLKGNKLLDDKLNDIYLIYKGYQQYLLKNNLLDSMDRLDLEINAINKSEYIKNSYVYVANFDSFTYQGFQLIDEILRTAKEFNIGLTKSFSVANEHIYNVDLISNFYALCNACGLKPTEYDVDFNLPSQIKHLQDNLFAFKPNKMKVTQNKINLFEGENFEQELLWACAQIKKLIIDYNYKFSDFIVCIPSLESRADLVKQIFDNFNFSYFIDISQKFDNSILARFIKVLFDVIEEGASKTSVLSLAKNTLLGLDYKKVENFEDYLNKYNINNFYKLKTFKNTKLTYYEDFDEVRCFIVNILDCFNNSSPNTYGDYVAVLEDVLLKLNVQQKLMEKAKQFAEQNNAYQAKLFEQYYNNLMQLFEEILNVLKYEKCDFKMFCSTLYSGLSCIKISTSPLGTNSIFVGDSSASFFDVAKNYFILGANDGKFPLVLNDCGIISDSEINYISDCYKLEPSIAQINFKERFKSFENVLKATDNLYLSYNFKDGNASKILQDICNMFVLEDGEGGFNLLSFKNYSDIDFITKNNNKLVAKNNFVASFRDYLDGQENKGAEASALYKFLNLTNKDILNFDYKNNLKLKTSMFFNNNSVSVSQVETFMTCPFLHYIRYGLKLKEVDEGDFDSLNIGKILHSVGELFLKQNTLPIKDDEIATKASDIFNKVIKEDIFETIRQKSINIVLIKNLQNEAIRFCEALNYQSKHSKFKPVYFEARFDDKNKIKALKIRVNNKLLTLVGQVDRIDIFEDFFRIIDYKTGKCDKSFKELFFGKKVQLEAYLKL